MKFYSFNQLPLHTDDFFFTNLGDLSKRDAIVIFNPPNASVVSPVFLRSKKSLAEHIDYIASQKIKKAVIVANDLDFLPQCPSLEYLWILPAIDTLQFDYSPIYKLPNIKWLRCETMYGETEQKTTDVDYCHFPNLQMLSLRGPYGHNNVHHTSKVVSLSCDRGYPNSTDLINVFSGTALKNLSICQSPIRTLNGIEAGSRIRRVELSYNRRLEDISALRSLKDSLVYLEIDTCGKVKDFSVLSELSKLEFLILKGSNVLPDLCFLNFLPQLKCLHLTMDVADGNTSLCKKIPYAKLKNRKHFTHTDKEMTKNYIDPEQIVPFHVL